MPHVCNGAVFITPATEPMFIKAVLSKLKGVARESVRDKQFLTINELIAHLKKRFAPTKKYLWYLETIVNLRMKHTLEEKDNTRYGQEKASDIMPKIRRT